MRLATIFFNKTEEYLTFINYYFSLSREISSIFCNIINTDEISKVVYFNNLKSK